MNKKQFVDLVAEKYNITKKDAIAHADQIFDTLIECIKSEKEVKIVNFGTFSLRVLDERTAINPRTLEKIRVPKREFIEFHQATTVSKDSK